MILAMSTCLLISTCLLSAFVRPVDMTSFGEKDFASVIQNLSMRSFWIFLVTPEFSERPELKEPEEDA